MKRFASVGFLLILILQVSTNLAFGDKAAECEALVTKAIAIVKDKGSEYAVKALSASNGPFVNKEIYIFACSLDNIMLAHPYKRDLIGKSVNEFKDAKGNLLFQECKKVAENGGQGWVNYWWWKPAEEGQFAKASYIGRVPAENLYVGAGYYTQPDTKPAEMSQSHE